MVTVTLAAMGAELAAMAADNGGPFSRHQAVQAGYTHKAIRHRLRKGAWVRLRAGVYAEREPLTSYGPRRRYALEAAAAVLAVRSVAAVVSHRSAAYLHGLGLLSPPSVVTLTRPPDDSHADKPGVHVHRARLPPGHTGRKNGVAVTSPARTVVDLGRSLSFREALVAADSAARTCGTVRADLNEVLSDCSNWPWIQRAARVVAYIDPAAESALESLARVLIAEAGLPAPRTQVLLGDSWGPIGRVDFYWPEYGVVLEVDGMVKYRDQPYALVAEKHRQERLERAGYIVCRLTWDDVVHFPDQGVRRIREALARASAR